MFTRTNLLVALQLMRYAVIDFIIAKQQFKLKISRFFHKAGLKGVELDSISPSESITSTHGLG